MPLHDRVMLGVLCVPLVAGLIAMKDRVDRRTLPWRRDAPALGWRGALGWGLAGGVGAFLAVTFLR